MFARVKKSSRYEYLQIVENRRDGRRTVQRVICTVGRLDQLHDKGSVESLMRSLCRYSERVLLILSGKTDVSASAKKIGPALIFERLWEKLGIKKVIMGLVSERKFEFDVERAIWLTVVHRLFVSGSDRSCYWQGLSGCGCCHPPDDSRGINDDREQPVVPRTLSMILCA